MTWLIGYILWILYLNYELNKFVEGNNSAGTRVRKAMQAVKALAQEVRVEVQDQKNSQF